QAGSQRQADRSQLKYYSQFFESKLRWRTPLQAGCRTCNGNYKENIGFREFLTRGLKSARNEIKF
ncbi:MAG: hypothetical protein QG646_3923, partial [Euryarchaeota archaeon]|nr:hypothetical protein [Euryarchaeota archaeon]